jgi:hypothetical protein
MRDIPVMSGQSAADKIALMHRPRFVQRLPLGRLRWRSKTQVLGSQQWAWRQNDGAPKPVFQFAHIARPGMAV